FFIYSRLGNFATMVNRSFIPFLARRHMKNLHFLGAQAFQILSQGLNVVDPKKKPICAYPHGPVVNPSEHPRRDRLDQVRDAQPQAFLMTRNFINERLEVLGLNFLIMMQEESLTEFSRSKFAHFLFQTTVAMWKKAVTRGGGNR
ncbi:hypothetical protein ACJX0J_030321, partial [Zea mays]